MIGRCRLAWTLWKEQCRRTELDSLLGHIGREHSVELDEQDVAARRAAQLVVECEAGWIWVFADGPLASTCTH